MDTIVKENELVDSEKERLDLCRELGCVGSLQFESDLKKMSTINTKEWIDFENFRELRKYLRKKFGVFKETWLGKPFYFPDFIHNLESYRQRIPMSALLKLKEAKETGIFSEFAIIDPDLRAMKGDPFLIGFKNSRRFPGFGFLSIDMDDSPTLICWWLKGE